MGLEIDHQRSAALAGVAKNRLDGLERLEFHDFAEWKKSGLADAQGQLPDLLIVGAEFFGHTHHDFISLVALDNLAGFLAG